jgi:hypothetical protein
MTMSRTVAAETLDSLAENDPRAMRSRRDLRRVHRAMGTRLIVRRALRDLMAQHSGNAPLRVLELGAGDGSLMLGVARSLVPAWPAVELTLLDRQALVNAAIVERYAQVGWTAAAKVMDVLDWAASSSDKPSHNDAVSRWDLIVANLFLHHFEGAELNTLLGAITASADRFFACEPRRAWLALAGSHLLGVIGANAVTREDAVLSVHAGFRDDELTTMWPAHGVGWRVQEYSAGLFSHCFRAERIEAN